MSFRFSENIFVLLGWLRVSGNPVHLNTFSVKHQFGKGSKIPFNYYHNILDFS